MLRDSSFRWRDAAILIATGRQFGISNFSAKEVSEVVEVSLGSCTSSLPFAQEHLVVDLHQEQLLSPQDLSRYTHSIRMQLEF